MASNRRTKQWQQIGKNTVDNRLEMTTHRYQSSIEERLNGIQFYADKIIIQCRLESYMKREMPIIQAVLRKKWGTILFYYLQKKNMLSHTSKAKCLFYGLWKKEW